MTALPSAPPLNATWRSTLVPGLAALAVFLLVVGSCALGVRAAGAAAKVTIKVTPSQTFPAKVTLEGTATPAEVLANAEGSVILTAKFTDDKTGQPIAGQPVFFSNPTIFTGITVPVGTVEDAVTQTNSDGVATALLKFKPQTIERTLVVNVDFLGKYHFPEQPAKRHSGLVDVQAQGVSDRDLAGWLKNALTAGEEANVLNAIFLFQTCFGGGMLDDLRREIGKTFPWVGGTAAGHFEPSWYHGTSVDTINKRIEAIDRDLQALGNRQDLKAREARQTFMQRREATVRLLQAARTQGLPEAIGGRSHGYWTSALVDELQRTQGKKPPVPMLTLLLNAQQRDPVGPKGTRTETGNYVASASGADIVFVDPDVQKVKKIYAILWAGQADLVAHFHDIDQMERAIRARASGRPVDIQILFGDGERSADGTVLPKAWRVKATRKNLEDAITRVKAKIAKEDQFIFYASGHGTYTDDPPQLAPANAANRSVFPVAPLVMVGTILTAESSPTVTVTHRNVLTSDLLVAVNGVPLGHLDPSGDTTSFIVPRELIGTCAVVTIQGEAPDRDYEYEAAVTFSPGGMSPVFVVGGALPAPDACPDVVTLLSPLSATNPEGATHTVTARLVDDGGTVLSGREVTFRVLSGPNAGRAGAAVTGADGAASFTYTGRGVGVDEIRAFAEDGGVALLTNTVLGAWTQPSIVTELSGSASRVGLEPEPGRDAGAQVRLVLRVAFEGPINLGAARITVDRLLDEADGTGELLEGTDGAALLPIGLAPKPGGTWSEVSYETPAGEIPKVRVKITGKSRGLYELSLNVDRATLPRFPLRCGDDDRPATPLGLNLVLEDGLNPSVAVSTTALWRCLDLTAGDQTRPRSLRTP